VSLIYLEGFMFSMFSPSNLRGWPLLLLSSTQISSNGLPVLALASSITLISLDGTHPGTTIMRVATAPARAPPLLSKRPGSRISYGLLLPLLAIGLRRRLRAMPRSLLLATLGMLSLGAPAAASLAAAAADASAPPRPPATSSRSPRPAAPCITQPRSR
jgi:hypothetical protein